MFRNASSHVVYDRNIFPSFVDFRTTVRKRMSECTGREILIQLLALSSAQTFVLAERYGTPHAI